jgi:hypothetical protein
MQVELSKLDLEQLALAAVTYANKKSHAAFVALREGNNELSEALDEESLEFFALHDRLDKLLDA